MKTTESLRAFTLSDRAVPFLLALGVLAAFVPSLTAKKFIYDDRAIIEDNPLIHQGLKALPRLWTSGYWQMVQGSAARVSEYRPLLMSSFLAEAAVFGLRPIVLRFDNLALHFCVCVLVWLLFKRRFGSPAAAAGAVLFAVLAVHAEDVDMLVGRSEILSAGFVLGAWLCLDGARARPRPALGLALYGAALLCKESAVMFLPLMILDDWCVARGAFRRRALVYAALLAVLSGYLVLRALVLPHPFQSGVPYFASGLSVRILTMSRFFWAHYFWPSLSGLGLGADFSRPLIADASPASFSAWAALLVLALGAFVAGRAIFVKRSQEAFWAAAPFLFLIPTSNLILRLDAIGAQRFLYFPSLSFCAVFALIWRRFSDGSWVRASAAAFLIWQAFRSFMISVAWATPLGFYFSAVRFNPVSARSQCSLGGALIEAGQYREGLDRLRLAAKLSPGYAQSWYNIGRMAWEAGNYPLAESTLKKAAALDPNDPDAPLLLADIAEKQGRFKEALGDLRRAMGRSPDDPRASYNLGLFFLRHGTAAQAAPYLKKFLEDAPDDPAGPEVAALLKKAGE